MIEFAGKKIPQQLEEIIQSGRTALLFWDVQVGIMSRVHNAPAIIANMGRLREAARFARIPIFYSQQTAYKPEDETPAWIRIKMRRAKVAHPAQIPDDGVEGTAGWQILDALKPDPTETTFKKRRPSAFVGTDFDLML